MIFAKFDADFFSNPKVIELRAILGDDLAIKSWVLFCHVLCQNQKRGRTGRIPLRDVAAWTVKHHCGIDPPLVESLLAALVRVEMIARDTAEVWIVGWDDEWAKGPQSDAERQAKRRARSKSIPPPPPQPAQLMLSAPPEREPDNTCHETSRDDRDASRSETACRDSHASDQSRSETETEGEHARTRARSHTPTPLPDGWEPAATPENAHAAREAESRGVVVPYATAKFCEHARAHGLTSCDWDASHRKWLHAEHATPPQIRDALAAQERARSAQAARERERANVMQPRDPAIQAELASMARSFLANGPPRGGDEPRLRLVTGVNQLPAKKAGD